MAPNSSTFRSEAKEPRPDEVTDVDLLELAGILLHKWWVLLIGAVVAGVIAAVYTVGFVVPTYQATSTIYIYNKTTSITSLADLQVGASLTVDFQIIATTREVIESVIGELNLNTTYSGLVERVSVSNPSGSHMLRITASDSDPARAADISNTLAEKLRDQIAEIMNTERPSFAERAVVPSVPSSPSLKKNVTVGALVGVLAVAAYYTLKYLLDDTLKNGDDVRKYLGLNPLATIPLDREVLGKSDSEKRRRRRGSGSGTHISRESSSRQYQDHRSTGEPRS